MLATTGVLFDSQFFKRPQPGGIDIGILAGSISETDDCVIL
jgi:hypothetical protein